HDGHDRLPARRRLAGVPRQVGDDAVDRAGDPGVAELRLRGFEAAPGGLALRGRGLQLLVAREALEVLEALAWGFVLCACLAEAGGRIVDVLFCNRALAQKTLTVLVDRLLRVQRVLRGARLQLGLLRFLRNRRPGGCFVSGLRLVERCAALGRGA